MALVFIREDVDNTPTYLLILSQYILLNIMQLDCFCKEDVHARQKAM